MIQVQLVTVDTLTGQVEDSSKIYLDSSDIVHILPKDRYCIVFTEDGNYFQSSLKVLEDLIK